MIMNPTEKMDNVSPKASKLAGSNTVLAVSFILYLQCCNASEYFRLAVYIINVCISICNVSSTQTTF